MSEALVARHRLRPRLPVSFGSGDLLAAIQRQEAGPRTTSWPSDGGRPFLVSSGRAALWLLLRGLDLPANPRIGVPLFCCEAVFEAIERAGGVPVFLDVDPDTLVLDAARWTSAAPVDAVIAVHLFGNPVGVPHLQTATRVPIIEDCAHAFFGEIHGRPVGSVGDGAMYSFGLGKPISLGRLGAAATVNRELGGRLETLHRNLPRESSRRKVSRAVMSRLVAALYHEPWYGMFAFKVAQQYESGLDPMGKAAAPYEAVPSSMMGIVTEKVARYRGTVGAQREAWQHLSDAVEDASGGEFVPQQTTAGCVSDGWLFAVRCPSIRDRDRLVDGLARHGVDSMKFYDRVPSTARDRFGYRGGAPNAESLCKSVVVVPVRVPTDRDRGERLVGAFTAAIRGAR